MGAVLREQNALPYEAWDTRDLTAKTDVDNVGAGRAAKGASPVASTTEKVLKQKVSRLFSFSKIVVKIMLDHLRILHRFLWRK